MTTREFADCAARKICTKCNQDKPIDEFPRVRKGSEKRRSQCRKCTNFYLKSYMAENEDKRAANAAKAMAWNKKNPERYLASVADARTRLKLTDPERYRAGVIERANNRRARKKGQFIERVYRARIWLRDAGVCRLCNTPADPDNWELEHLTPLSRGGEHSHANCAVSHPSCNRAKHNKTLEEWNSIRMADDFLSLPAQAV